MQSFRKSFSARKKRDSEGWKVHNLGEPEDSAAPLPLVHSDVAPAAPPVAAAPLDADALTPGAATASPGAAGAATALLAAAGAAATASPAAPAEQIETAPPSPAAPAEQIEAAPPTPPPVTTTEAQPAENEPGASAPRTPSVLTTERYELSPSSSKSDAISIDVDVRPPAAFAAASHDVGDIEEYAGDDASFADEASLKVWCAYQRWRVTKIRLGSIPNMPPAKAGDEAEAPVEESMTTYLFSAFVGPAAEAVPAPPVNYTAA
ncbi:hypothetical protein M885DRAFT_621866 [Pelagophyceae sp. CCMP2097]|nr:hypothetical protein M885DRAFT_621866 [Pelagophyceae sp. CCMP2097]|mmetsp:Transcript_20937/g.74429  ORF Transcript_20937/g.74429 Transcript_20937/m.74429 type:complete len:263 (+) Transcript_20937:85-873(+)